VSPDELAHGKALSLAVLVDGDQDNFSPDLLIDFAVHANLDLLTSHARVPSSCGVIDAGHHQISIEIAGRHAVPVDSPSDAAGVWDVVI
jgi:hypothetical protein